MKKEQKPNKKLDSTKKNWTIKYEKRYSPKRCKRI